MSDRTEVAQNLALAAVAGLVALVLAGVLALAIGSRARHGPAPGAAAAPAPPVAAPNVPAQGAMVAPVERLYFDAGSAVLPGDAGEVLGRVADAARANAGAAVLISGYHDASGDPARNAELAKERALAVRHALQANGVASEQLVMSRPAVTSGAGDARQARRVELTLQ